MKLFAKIILLNLFVVSFTTVFAADPSYNFLPVSWTQLKLHCNYIWNLHLSVWWLNYNAFESTILYDSSNVNIDHVSINSPFTQNQWYAFSGDLYRAYWSLPLGQKSLLDTNAINYNFKTLNNILFTEFAFSNYLWSTIIFGPSTTDDGATLNGFDVNGADILTAAYNATYFFVPLNCIPDSTSPSFVNTIPATNARYVPEDQIVSFVVYDWAGAGFVNWPAPLATNNRSHYWYSGLSLSLSNYVPAPVSVDNQEGVNSWSFIVNISCTSCSSSWSYLLSWSDLIVSDWIWDGSRNQWTWNSNRRWYNVSFLAPAAYEIEKQVTVSLQAVDNPNENMQIHTWAYTFSFNASRNPIVTRLLPSSNTFVSPSKNNVIRFYVSDDWAGIDTWTTQITISTVMSWSQQLLTWYTYSWSELNFLLSWWNIGLGNSGKYIVDFYSNRDLPGNETIFITWRVADLVWNLSTFTTFFTTRPDCDYFGCSSILNIDILDWAYSWVYQFTWYTLIVTWTNPTSPYPYLTWLNNDILMCGVEWTWSVLTWNINIYDQNDAIINWTVYSNDVLYVTGLNFILSDWTIIVQ